MTKRAEMRGGARAAVFASGGLAPPTGPRVPDPGSAVASSAPAAGRSAAATGAEETPCRWRRRRDARPGEILLAALELFSEHGFAATRVEEIAVRAGVTKGTVYLYYRSKEELFRSVVEESIVPTLSLGDQLLATEPASATAILRALIAAWWDAMSCPTLSKIPKLMAAEAANFPGAASYFARQVLQRGRSLFARVLELGIEQGEFRADLDVDNVARLALAPVVWALVHRHSLQPFDDNPTDLDSFLEAHVDVFLRGIAAQTGRVAG
jgi:AcrR family transcriptional regulator